LVLSLFFGTNFGQKPRGDRNMPFYETVFIARQELSQTQVNELTEGFCKIIKDGGGKVHKTEDWGIRTLAYRINKSRKGHYVLIESDTPPAALVEMERHMRLDENIIRFLSVKTKELSDGPSVMMRKHDDDSGSSDRKSDKEAA
jgi:small subunit ribosomal protein S6